jgi:hypothetical protein
MVELIDVHSLEIGDSGDVWWWFFDWMRRCDLRSLGRRKNFFFGGGQGLSIGLVHKGYMALGFWDKLKALRPKLFIKTD